MGRLTGQRLRRPQSTGSLRGVIPHGFRGAAPGKAVQGPGRPEEETATALRADGRAGGGVCAERARLASEGAAELPGRQGSARSGTQR